MKRKILVLAVLAVGLVWMTGPQGAEGSDTAEAETPAVAPTTIKEPHRLEAGGAEFPSRVPAEEAERLFLRMGLSPNRHSAAGAARSEATAPVHAANPSGGVSRTIELPVPEVVNRTDRFVFRDVTDREDQPPRRQMTMEDRRKAVEAYRLRLIRSKNKGAGKR